MYACMYMCMCGFWINIALIFVMIWYVFCTLACQKPRQCEINLQAHIHDFILMQCMPPPPPHPPPITCTQLFVACSELAGAGAGNEDVIGAFCMHMVY